MGSYILAVTGASGALYACSTARSLIDLGHDIYITVTDPGRRVLREELSWDLPALRDPGFLPSLEKYLGREGTSRLTYFDCSDVGAPIASGSFRTDGMIVVPCSMSTLAGIAAGVSENLVERAADIMLKEHRPLILVPRETPFNQIHLRNMLELARMGVHIVPACPGFYHNPQTFDDLAHFMAGKVLDLLNIDHNLYQRWKGGKK